MRSIVSNSSMAIVCEYPSLLGGERSLLAVLDWAFAQGIIAPANITAFVPDGGIRQAFLDRCCQAITWPDEVSTASQRVDFLKETCADRGISRVHANSLSMGRVTGQLRRESAIRCTAHLRDIARPSRQALEDIAANDRLIAVSEATRRYYIELGVPPDRIVTVWNGIDVDEWGQAPTGQIRRMLCLHSEDRVLVSVGQIGLRKGQLTIARAAREIVAAVPTAQFVFVGTRFSQKVESIEYHRQIRLEFDDPLLQGRFHEIGYRSDIPAILSEADLLIHAANQEPFGRVILEGMAAGLPIVATDVGGTRELLEDGVSGRLISPNSPTSLAAAAIELLNDCELRRSFGSQAKERVQCLFGIERSARQLLNHWQS